MKKFLLKLLTIVFALTLSLGIFTACGESHIHDYKTLKYDSENHWFECECGDKNDTQEHKGGTATCDKKAKCEVCEQEYGDFGEHTYSSEWTITDTHHYKESTCGCNVKKDYGTHNLGEDGICSTCRYEVVKYTVGLQYIKTANQDGYVLCGIGTSEESSIIVPSKYKGLPVVEVAEQAFISNKYIISVIIPNSVTKIGKGAFENCSSLTSITLPFVGESLEGTGNTHFGYIFGASSYSYNDDYVPSSLKEVIITGCSSIDSDAFYNCYSLTSIVIPNSVTSIGDYAFSGCSLLTSITIPNSVTSLGDSAFSGCSSLTSVVIPDTVTSIGYQAFRGCSSLTSIEIPNSVTSIGEWAFYYCSKLTSVTIGNSVTSIGDYAFENCRKLTSVEIPDSVTSIGNNAFYNCSSLTSVVIPNSVTSIGSSAFEGCSKLTSIVLPNSITSIGSSAFEGCSKLTNIIVDDNNVYYKSIDGNLYSKDGKTLIQYAIGKTGTSFTIPNSVTSIGDFAFEYCSSLTSIVIPNSVTSICERAFYNCTAEIKWGDAPSITEIGYSAFYGYKGTSITIPNSVTSIGDSAFGGCSSLTSVVIPNSVTSIGDSAFEYCSSLTSIVIPNSVTSIDEEAFYNCFSLIYVTIGNSVTSIGEDAFRDCSKLTSIVIPNSVTSIGEDAFRGCSKLTSVTFNDTSTWYSTTSSSNWENKTGGTETDVTNPSTNATYFKSTYFSYYWYKK